MAASGMETFLVTPWRVRSPTAVTSTLRILGGDGAQLDGLREHEGGGRELVGLDALATQLAVAHRLVAGERGQVDGQVRGRELRAREGDGASDVRRPPDRLRAADADQLLLGPVAGPRAGEDAPA